LMILVYSTCGLVHINENKMKTMINMSLIVNVSI
jgi:hypothetical protein